MSSRWTRRQWLGGAGLLLAATACANPSADRDAAGSVEGFPVHLPHRYGTTEIPAPPRRIVTVGLTEQDYVLALGAAPVGAREWFGDHPGALWPWAREALRGRPVPTSLAEQEIEFERIAELEPDLILGMNSGLTEQEYRLLSRVAPTVAQPAEHADYGAPWQELTRITGRALGRDREADRLVADVEQRFERARRDHPKFRGATGLLATSIDGSAYVYATGPAPRFLESLGLRMPPAAERLFSGDDDRAPVRLSAERLDVLNADVLLLGVYGGPGEGIAGEGVYQRLRVAREGRDVMLPERSRVNGALSFGSVLSLPLALDELVPRIAAAVDGDPGTRPEPVR